MGLLVRFRCEWFTKHVVGSMILGVIYKWVLWGSVISKLGMDMAWCLFRAIEAQAMLMNYLDDHFTSS